MTLFKSTDGVVAGQPMSPSFGAQNGAQGAGAVGVQLPAGMPLLVAASLGLIPANCLVNTVNSVSPGGNPAVIGSDPCSVMQLLSDGNGSETARGASTAPNGAINQQIFSDGFGGPAQVGNGSIPKNTSALTECPVSGATLCQTVALFSGQFEG